MSFLLSLGSSGLINVVRLILFRHWLSASQPAEDLSARLVVDGVPYRESIGSYALLSRHASSGILERDVVLNLQVRTVLHTPNAPCLAVDDRGDKSSICLFLIDDALVACEMAILIAGHNQSRGPSDHKHCTACTTLQTLVRILVVDG